MLLQELVELRHRVSGEIPPPYYKRRKIRFAVELNKRGSFQGWACLGDEKGLLLDVPYLRRSGQTSYKNPYLLADKCSNFLLPKEPTSKKEKEKAREKFEESKGYYLTLLEKLLESDFLESTEVPLVKAVHSFLTSKKKLASLKKDKPEDLTEDQIILFRVGGKWVHDLPGVQLFWEEFMDEAILSKAERELECLVCGEVKLIPQIAPIEVLLGADRVQVISANEDAFESHGFRRNENAPVCHTCARYYGEALVYLLSNEKHRQKVGSQIRHKKGATPGKMPSGKRKLRIGEVTYLYWTRDEEEFDIDELLSKPTEESVRELFRSPVTGQPGDLEENRFFALAVSANTSRMVVRSHLNCPLSEVKGNLANWFRKQSFSKGGEKPFGVYSLAMSLVREEKHLSPRVLPSLMQSALFGQKLPKSFLSLAFQRVRADTEHRLTRPRAAIIKMVMIDHLGENAVKNMLDPEKTSPAYLCGRLMAILEDLQRSALGKVKATVKDKYYSTASSSPASVFPRLLSGAMKHFQKLRKTNGPAYISIWKRYLELVGALESFPTVLTIDEQGDFHVGYVHQVNFRWERIEEAIEAKEEKKRAAQAA